MALVPTTTIETSSRVHLTKLVMPLYYIEEI